ncbi:nonstructural protein [Chagres virus]|uniref:Nonstructural protein n=1 Tax=Chagres virus TaxID=629727 RepID=I1T327_9VIRU|nr:nonstructural protein [Chagres virus]AEL29644.1 nonstructural protein [Chagres virus]
MNYYATDIPLVSFSACQLRRIQVDYIPFNKQATEPHSNYSGMEFPVTSYTQVPGIRSKLQDFYNHNQLPVSWGSGRPGVVNDSSSKYESLIKEISKLELRDVVKHNEPNIRRALCWPYSYPTLIFFDLCGNKDSMGPWMFKGAAMTSFMRAGKCAQIDRSLVNFHRMIVREAIELGENEAEFTGKDIIMECCSVICRRLLRAYPFDRTYDKPHSRLLTILEDFDNHFKFDYGESSELRVAVDEFDIHMKRREAEETFWGSDFTDSD